MKERHHLQSGKGSAPTDILWTDEKLWMVAADGRILVWDQTVLPKTAETSSEKASIENDNDVDPLACSPFQRP